LALLFDGKYVEIRDGDRLKPACIYRVVGLGRDGKKRVLTCLAKSGRENLEDWKLVLRSLLERGLRRVLILIQDDFSGLLPITKSLFPTADVQLCVVHMQRNAKNHLSKNDSAQFQQPWRALRDTWDEQVGLTQFEELCQRFDHDYPAFMGELRKKRDHYLAFLKYPDAIRRSLSTTNVVEAVNGQLEIMRRNSGGLLSIPGYGQTQTGNRHHCSGEWALGQRHRSGADLPSPAQCPVPNALRIGELNSACVSCS
jgi:putative transposase